MIENLYRFKDELTREGIIFCFNGPTSQEILVSIGEALRHKMREDEAGLTTSNKVFSIFVEQVQNIIRYSAETVCANDLNCELRLGIVAVGRQDDNYYVLCGNRIETEKAETLRGILETLRGMDKKRLKTYFKETIRAPRPAESRGAGLGFIEMARKASGPIEYEIRPIDDRYSFFSYKAVIQKQGAK